MTTAYRSLTKPVAGPVSKPRGSSSSSPVAARRRAIPFRVLADAFATEDEELAPEPDWADYLPRGWDR